MDHIIWFLDPTSGIHCTYNNFVFLDLLDVLPLLYILCATYQIVDFDTKFYFITVIFAYERYYRNFVWIHVFFTMNGIVDAQWWMTKWSPVGKEWHIVSIISFWKGFISVCTSDFPCYWMTATSLGIICWIEWIFLVSLWMDSQKRYLWTRKWTRLKRSQRWL